MIIDWKMRQKVARNGISKLCLPNTCNIIKGQFRNLIEFFVKKLAATAFPDLVPHGLGQTVRRYFFTADAATPGVVDPAADVDVVVPDRCSEDDEESAAPEAAAAAAVDDEAGSGLRRQ